MPTPIYKRNGVKTHQSSSIAKKAARNAMLKVAGTTKVSQTQLERVVQSVNDATKRLSQAESILSTSTTTKSSKRKSRDTVGPWKLGKTLGKGSSGRVRLAKNMETGQLAAIKIVPKRNNLHSKNDASSISNSSSNSYTSTSSNTSTILNTTVNTNTNASHSNVATNPYGIEREIVIMKLISHANVLGLYEVWENKSELYLVLEYVDGGELFDYLVSKGKLCEREAVHYFKQIVQGVSYCHSFNICHRDLKPENLLLDKKNRTIKIADFGMAALEVSNKLLQTSCGSPHYASPEIVMGKPYHGGPSDVWSCGIILFALLTGHLPFNDDSIKKLLLKVQAGKYQMPLNLSKEARDLISKILVVNPARRLKTEEILRHPLIVKYDKFLKPQKSKPVHGNMAHGKSNSDLHLLNDCNPVTVTLSSRNDIDDTILSNLQILWHGASRELIVAKLLQPTMCEEKVFYSLLLQYKEKHSLKQENRSLTDLPNENVEGSQKASNDDLSAPRLVQKSQFSIPAMKQEEMYQVPSLPSNSLPPTVPVFAASSSRSFKKSGSVLSLQSRRSLESRTSLHTSPSSKTLSRTNSKRTLQNSASKRSLYSLQSISKRSLNLNEYVSTDNTSFDSHQLPPLPSLDSNNEFENLCEQILFGNALDKILEEEEEPEEREQSQNESFSSDATLKQAEGNMDGSVAANIKPAFVFNEQQSENASTSASNVNSKSSLARIPFKDITNTHEPAMIPQAKLKRDVSQKSNLANFLDHQEKSNKWPSAGREMRISSAKEAHTPSYSLDPRRNVSQPVNSKVVASLLKGFRSKSNLKDLKKDNHWAHPEGSIFTEPHEVTNTYLLSGTGEERLRYPERQPTINSTLPNFDNTEMTDLAHSSTIHKPLLSMPSSMLDSSTTFKNLNEYLQESNESYLPASKRYSNVGTMRKHSTKISLAAKSALKAGLSTKSRQSQANSNVSNDFDDISDMSYAMEIPTNTFMAQAITISNGGSAEHVVSDQGHKENNADDDMIYNYTPSTTYEEGGVNMFEDAPIDSDSMEITSSESDASPNAHRKAVSIDTLNTTNVLAPATNMRVSLYVNNNLNSNTTLPRETTEEIISKFKLSPEKPPAHLVQKRFSMTPANQNSDMQNGSQSMLSMFKDLEEDQEDGELSQADMLGSSLKEKLDKQHGPEPNRVTMLFDADEVDRVEETPKNDSTKQDVAELTHKPETTTGNQKEQIKSKVKPKLKPATKVRAASTDFSYNSATEKQNWFTKLFGGFKSHSSNKSFVQDHKTFISFDNAHILTLNEFDKNAVEYHLKSSQRKGNKESVEYDCKFVSGNFKFKIKIVSSISSSSTSTVITVRKKGRTNVVASERAFQVFNADVARVIRQEEIKTN